MLANRQPSVANFADAIAIAQTFTDLELVRRDLRVVTTFAVSELEVLQSALEERERELIEYYRGRF